MRGASAGEPGRADQPFRHHDGIGLMVAIGPQVAQRDAAIFGGKAGALLVAVESGAHRKGRGDRGGDVAAGGDRRRFLADDMGRRDRIGESDRLDIAGDMIGPAIAPGEAAGIFEHRELLARQQLRHRRRRRARQRTGAGRAPQPRTRGRA